MMAYEFTSDWVGDREALWRDIMSEYVGKPGLYFLEVGSYEGRSAAWWLDNVLTGEDCHLTCVDPWKSYDDRPGDDWDEVFRRFKRNVGGRASWQAKTLRESGCVGPYDFVYIDGSHRALDVLLDASLAWPALRVGGIILLDDYDWRPSAGPTEDCPKTAIDAFLCCVGEAGRVLHKQGQVAIRRLK